MTPKKNFKNLEFIFNWRPRVRNGSPDMILTAFDGKFDEKKDEIPPGACRRPNKLKKNNG